MNTPKAIKEPWIQTYTGIKFWIDNPKEEDINIFDIAHSLSMLCRFVGHTKFFYSVAQHCYLASFLCPDHVALMVLLHDASEAYLGDVSSPLKYFLGQAYTDTETKLQNLIYSKFGLNPNKYNLSAVDIADKQMLNLEAHNVLNNNPIEDWCSLLPTQEIITDIREGWEPKQAEEYFINRFTELNRKRK